jgi:hypothetical protein
VFSCLRLEFITNIEQTILIDVGRHLYHCSLRNCLSGTRNFNLLLFNYRFGLLFITHRTASLQFWSLSICLKHDVTFVKTCLGDLTFFPQTLLQYIAKLIAFCINSQLRRSYVRLFNRVFPQLSRIRFTHRHTAIFLNKKRWVCLIIKRLSIFIWLFKSSIEDMLATVL